MTTFYIATRGSREGIVRARRVRDVLEHHGMKWTFDWTIDMQTRFDAGLKDHDLTLEHKRKYAAIDRDAVRAADFVVYLEGEKSEGASGEVCFALAFERPIFVSLSPTHEGPPGCPRALFAALVPSDHVFADDDALLDAVLVACGRVTAAGSP